MPRQPVVRGKARGGVMRARSLPPEERSRIAKSAAESRWDSEMPQAVCGSLDRPLRIGSLEIPCFVLGDGTRVLSQAGFLEALGRHRKANVRREGLEEGGERLPALLQGKAISQFITAELVDKSRPIAFRTPEGARASGYRAELLPSVCDLYLQARAANVLPKNQEHVAKAAEILVRGLAHTGIIALVDEATGYQELRATNALARILEDFIDKELRAWVTTFPEDFYRHLFRLRGLTFPQDAIKRPQYFGMLTNDLVYRRLAPGVLEELKRVTPRTEKGRRKHKYFQRLTQDIGYPKLREHLGAVVAIMKLSDAWRDFMDKLDRLYPRYGDTIVMPLDYGPDDGKGL